MIYHIVVGDCAARPLLEAISVEPAMAGEVIVMKDILHVGPLKRGEEQSFSALRSEWWHIAAPSEKDPIAVDDLERLLQVSTELNKDEDAAVWLWMAPAPADVMAYYWMLPYLAKHVGRFFMVNTANLPFLNESGKVFYPKSIAEILPRELVKARKLARAVTIAEVEMDTDVAQNLMEDTAGIRTLEGGKKIASREADYYDAKLLNYCSAQFAKASKILSSAFSKEYLPVGDVYLAWRLRQLAEQGILELQGDFSRSFKDWEVRFPKPAEVSESL